MGSHELKFGALYSHNIKNEQAGGAAGGNTPTFITGMRLQNRKLHRRLAGPESDADELFEIDHTAVALGRWRDTEFYGNDTWKVRPNCDAHFGPALLAISGGPRRQR